MSAVFTAAGRPGSAVQSPRPVSRKPYRLAAIDVGTNSIHMIIVEAEQRGYRIIDKEKEMVQLGRGSLGGQPLTDEAMRRGIEALRTMHEIAERWEVDEIMVVATSALREAPNRDAFLEQAESVAGAKVQVISGEEEADYIFRAVRSAVDFRGGTALCIDIGGGSLELIVGTMDEVYYAASEPLGALRLSQKFFGKQGEGLEACERHVHRTLKRSLGRVVPIGFDLCIGTSGTIVTLAEMCSDRANQDDIAAGMKWLSRVGLGLLIPRLAGMSAEKRAATFDIDPRRAETILAGAVVVHEILDTLDADGLWACSVALREGIVERALSRRRSPRTTQVNVRAASILALAERSNYERSHAGHVSRLALRIFDQTARLHSLGPQDREILEHAATLHEIGVHVSFQRHHKHSYYLIRHAGLKGFSDEEVAMIANVARYYRKAPPDGADPNLEELSAEQRRSVEKLVAILRIADGLDRGHNQNVRDVTVKLESKRARFKIRPRGDASLEVRSAKKRSKYFARLFNVKTEIA
jgi:exopolyphosphatase/guanosine-5'-triphosphate,3'-diphosphate pyrophosphatase